MPFATPVLLLLLALTPGKTWFAPDQPLKVNIDQKQPVTLVLTDFVGRTVDPLASAEPATHVQPGAQVDLKNVFPPLNVGCYLLYAVPEGKAFPAFVGTPLVISVRGDKRPGAPTEPVIFKITPLQYIQVDSDAGAMSLAMYYDTAPHTVEVFLNLAAGGYFDGLVFHRIVPDFVIQAGDPLGRDAARAGTGGPGFQIDAEFSDRPHLPGVLSMARQGDPIERQGAMPRSDAANSAGSQFFICLDYAKTKQLDGRYTAFGRVIDGMDAVKKIGQSKIADPANGRPATLTTIKSMKVVDVTPENNPYAKLFSTEAGSATTQPIE